MEKVMADLYRKILALYLDDVMVSVRDVSQHLKHLWEVLQRGRLAGLKLKPRKCTLSLMQLMQMESTWIRTRSK